MLIDAVSSDEPLDETATCAWLAGGNGIDETVLSDADLEGPLEYAAAEERTAAMIEFVRDVISKMPAQH